MISKAIIHVNIYFISTVPSQQGDQEESKIDIKEDLPQEAAPHEHETETYDGKYIVLSVSH